MKKIILIFALIVFASTGIKSQILVESFDYPAGDSLQQHGWVTIGTVFTNQVKVVIPGLDFSGYQLPGVGNATYLQNTGQDVYKQLTSTVTSGSVYAFFLIRVDTARALGDYFSAYLPATSTTNFAARVYVRKAVTQASNNISFGIIKNAIGGGGLTYGDSTYTTGTTYLLCAKHTFVSGAANDVVSLFIYSPGDVVPNIEPAPTVVAGASTTADIADIGRYAIRQGQVTIASNVSVDEFYIGTDWGTLLPVELMGFSYSINKNNVNLNWSTVSELNNSGFEIERASSNNGQFSKVGFVSGNGTSNAFHNYSFTDRAITSGKYIYRLKQIDFNGNFEYFNLNNEVNIGAPATFNLSQNFPNPFNPSTKINFEIPVDGNVSLKVYNNSGKEVATLVNEFKTAGYYTSDFALPGLSSGIYFYTLKSESNGSNFTSTKKMLLVK